jgi:hypothetical protein
VTTRLDTAVSKFFYRWYAEAAEKSGMNLLIVMIGGSIYPASLNVFRKVVSKFTPLVGLARMLCCYIMGSAS